MKKVVFHAFRSGIVGLAAMAIGMAEVAAADSTIAAGRLLYEQAIGADGGPVEARHPVGGWRLPPAAAACANCHGLDADGGREGATVAPPLRGIGADAQSRSRLEQALREGRSAGGRTLDPLMPRFVLAAADLDALQSYLATRVDRAADRPRFVTLQPRGSAQWHREEYELARHLEHCLGGGGASPWRWDVVRHDGVSDALRRLAALATDPDVALVVAPVFGEGGRALVETELPVLNSDVTVLYPFGAETAAVSLDRVRIRWLFGGASQREQAIASVRAESGPTNAGSRGWHAVPARPALRATGSPRPIGTQWAEAACRTVTALVHQAPRRGPLESWPQWANRSLDRLGRIETVDGFVLEPSRPTAVNDWSVWREDIDGSLHLERPLVRPEATTER